MLGSKMTVGCNKGKVTHRFLIKGIAVRSFTEEHNSEEEISLMAWIDFKETNQKSIRDLN